MIGVDIIVIARIEKSLGRFGERFLARFLCEDEIVALSKRDFAPRSVAGFWAAKEACAKALGVGIGDRLRFHDMCVSYTPAGAPNMRLDSRKCEEFGVGEIALSISHDGGFAIAVVAIEKSHRASGATHCIGKHSISSN